MKKSNSAKNWWKSLEPDVSRFYSSSNDVSKVQDSCLFDLLKKNESTSYGDRFKFESIRSIREYQENVPLVDYTDLEPWINRIKAGEQNVLTSEQVVAFELTSGTTSGSKYIPYTADLIEEFRRGIAVWIDDMFRNIDGLADLTTYWSVSPSAGKSYVSEGGITIGLDSDADYLGEKGREYLASMHSVPFCLASVTDHVVHRYLTLRFLIEDSKLGWISVWHPSFLSIMVDGISEYSSTLIYDIRNGEINPPGDVDQELLEYLRSLVKENPERADYLQDIIVGRSFTMDEIWQNLKLISCWAAGNAELPSRELHKLAGNVIIQGKGLLATEGIITIPLMDLDGHALCINSHFYEFIDVGSPSEYPKLACELEEGRIYSVVISTGGGLYRYKLGDLVKVTGFKDQLPLLEFLGRESGTCDLRGEKLEERFTRTIIEQATREIPIDLGFAMIAPADVNPPHYVLYFESEQNDESAMNSLIDYIENRLKANIHYSHCRDLGQLAPLKGFKISSNANAAFIKEKAGSDGKLGDIKPEILDRQTNWHEIFEGSWIKVEPNATT